MDIDNFWQIIEKATKHDPKYVEDWNTQLVEQLVKLSADEILAWDYIFDSFTSLTYRRDLWAAAYLINGGASYDGFYYFRCWLIGMGQDVCMNAIEDPDSLANVVRSHWQTIEQTDAEADIYSVGYEAWQRVTGSADHLPYPFQSQDSELLGDDFNFDDDEAMRRLLPRLFQLFGEEYP